MLWPERRPAPPYGAPGRPHVVEVDSTTAVIEWSSPSLVEDTNDVPSGYCIFAQRGGSSGEWEVLVSDTHTLHGSAVVEGLLPETWYSFRVALVSETKGTGRGSPPSAACQTLKSKLRPVETREPIIVRPGASADQRGQTAAVAMVVARRAETTPPVSEEQSAYAATAMARALELSEKRKEVLDWESNFRVMHGRIATDAERHKSPRRRARVQQYHAVKSKGSRLFGDGNMDVLEPAQLASTMGGSGTMIEEQRSLAVRLTAESRTLYTELISHQCGSLIHADGLSELTYEGLDRAIRLFAQYDEDVDGLLSQDEFAAIYQVLAGPDHNNKAGAAGNIAHRRAPQLNDPKHDWRVAFHRADRTGSGFVDLNSLVLHLKTHDQLSALTAVVDAPQMNGSSVILSPAGSERSDERRGKAKKQGKLRETLAQESTALKTAEDSAVLADAEYMEKLVEQAQSVGSGFELDRLEDYRLLLRVLRLFRRYDQQRQGTLELMNFVHMVAPKLEEVLNQSRAKTEEEERAAERRRREAMARKDQFSLGMQYMSIAREAGPPNAKAAPSSTKQMAQRARALEREITSSDPLRTSSAQSTGTIVDNTRRQLGALTGSVIQMIREADGLTDSALKATFGLVKDKTHMALERVGSLSSLVSDCVQAHVHTQHPSSKERSLVAAAATPTGESEVLADLIQHDAKAPVHSAEAGVQNGEVPAEIKCGIAAVELARELFALGDTTRSGYIDFNEFVALLASGAIGHAAYGGDLTSFGGQMVRSNSGVRAPSPMKHAARLELADGFASSKETANEAHRTRMIERAVERIGGDSTAVFERVGDPSAEEAVQLFTAADLDHSGALTVSEFAEALRLASESSYSDGHAVGAMEARLWFAALDRSKRGVIDICQWLQLLMGDDPRRRAQAEHDPPLELTAAILRSSASRAARIGLRQDIDVGADAEAARSIMEATDLLEYGTAVVIGHNGVVSPHNPPQAVPPRPMFKGLTAAAEAAEDAAFEAAMQARFAESEARAAAEDERLHTYLSKIVSSAASTTILTSDGISMLEQFPTEDLSAALALIEHYDTNGDGRLQRAEFAEMLTAIARLNGTRFSSMELDRLFRSSDLASKGSVNMLEVLLLLQQLDLKPVAPKDAEAYRTRVLRTAARSAVKLEAKSAAVRRASRGVRRRSVSLEGEERVFGEAAMAAPELLRGCREGSILAAGDAAIDEVVLLLGRFDRGKKGFLTADEFRDLKDALAVQSGGRPFTATEHQLLFERADIDRSGNVDLNELYLHLKTAHPASLEQTSAAAWTPPTVPPPPPDATKDPATKVVAAPGNAGGAYEAEMRRRAQIDSLLERTVAELPPSVSSAFGDAELRALAGLFTDLDHDLDGTLSLQEFRMLLTLLDERIEKTRARRAEASGGAVEEGDKESSPAAPGPLSSLPLSLAAHVAQRAAEQRHRLGLREAHAVFRTLDLDASGALSFAELLNLLAADTGFRGVALQEARELRNVMRRSTITTTSGSSTTAATKRKTRRAGTGDGKARKSRASTAAILSPPPAEAPAEAVAPSELSSAKRSQSVVSTSRTTARSTRKGKARRGPTRLV